MKKVIFQGYLQTLYPEGISVDANSAAEALSLLEYHPGFRPDDDVKHYVSLPKFPTRDALYQPTDEEVIEVIPMVAVEIAEFQGAGGKGGLLQIIIGIIIIAIAIYTGNAFLLKVGIGITLGGLLQLIMPQPPKTSNESDPKSNYLAANKNTVKIGTPIPLLLGKFKVYGHFLSFNITAKNLNDPPPTTSTETAAGSSSGPLLNIEYDGQWEGKGG